MRVMPVGTIEILVALCDGPKRFSQLARIKVGSKRINRRTLAKRLRMLDEEHFIDRRVEDSWPPRPLYSLTERGQRLLNAVKE